MPTAMTYMVDIYNEYTNGIPTMQWLMLGSSSLEEARLSEYILEVRKKTLSNTNTANHERNRS